MCRDEQGLRRRESALMDIRALPTEHMDDAVLLANEVLAGR